MGMFDNIKCELPLPLNKKEQKTFSNINWNDHVFQTKDTDCTLSHYVIRKNGKFYGEHTEGELIRVISEEEEKKIKKQNRFCWPYKYKVKSKKYKLEKLTGDLYFYDHVIDINGNEWWVEFYAKFVNGVIQGKIKKKEVRFSESKEDIDKSKLEWEAMIETDYAKLHNKFRRFMNKITFNYWRYFWWGFAKYFRKLINYLSKVDLFVNRYIA